MTFLWLYVTTSMELHWYWRITYGYTAGQCVSLFSVLMGSQLNNKSVSVDKIYWNIFFHFSVNVFTPSARQSTSEFFWLSVPYSPQSEQICGTTNQLATFRSVFFHSYIRSVLYSCLQLILQLRFINFIISKLRKSLKAKTKLNCV